MRALYIGILSDHTTSKMRFDTLRGLLPEASWEFIDTDSGFRGAGRFSRSFSFRFKAGGLVEAINRGIASQVRGSQYDLVWVDKGVYLWPETTRMLRSNAAAMVHFTPDTAFRANRSRHFRKSAAAYDLLVTTKSFEIDEYIQLADPGRVMLTTQAYDSNLHRIGPRPEPRRPAAVFIGLWEPDRQSCISALLDAGVPVRVGGEGWGGFARRRAGDPNFEFIGNRVFGPAYAAEYQAASVGLGLLTRRFPELHTTRTFEIPACGALLATERTGDTVRFFDDGEALFFEDHRELARSVKGLLQRPDRVESIARKGRRRVLSDGRDYASVLSRVLERLTAD